MGKHLITFERHGLYEVEIDADTEEDAKDLLFSGAYDGEEAEIELYSIKVKEILELLDEDGHE